VLIQTLFVSVLADPEAIADGLNPLTISHTAKTISCKAIGMINKIVITGKRSNIDSTEPVDKAAAAAKPQPDNHRGMSSDLYNIGL